MKKLVNGILVNMTADEIAARQAEETAWNNGAFDRAMEEIRQKRNALLAETDHLALSDNTLTTEMTIYRQSLRDITNNVTTLDDIDGIAWPTRPSS